MNKNNKVNLFIIGVNKAGSSWLYYQLNAHPQIFMSEVKELYYFNNEYPDNIEKYHSNFPFDQDFKYFGEATPTYYRSKDTARNISHYSPKAKILAIIRDPIKRLYSQFYFHKQLGLISENTTLAEAINQDNNRLISDSHYEITLPEYKKIFGDNFLILSLEEAVNDIDSFWQQILNFLELKSVEMPEVSTRSENATGSCLFRLIYKYTIRPIKKNFPDLYKKLLKIKFMRESKIILLDLLGKADKKIISDELHKELKLEFEDTYQYLNSLGFSEIYKIKGK